jgi:hypothetical protein
MSTYTASKATRLLQEGRVRPNETLTTFEVRGDHGTYSIGLECDCPTKGMCSHLEAAFAWVTASPEDREIMEEIIRLKGSTVAAIPPPPSQRGRTILRITDEEQQS